MLGVRRLSAANGARGDVDPPVSGAASVGRWSQGAHRRGIAAPAAGRSAQRHRCADAATHNGFINATPEPRQDFCPIALAAAARPCCRARERRRIAMQRAGERPPIDGAAHRRAPLVGRSSAVALPESAVAAQGDAHAWAAQALAREHRVVEHGVRSAGKCAPSMTSPTAPRAWGIAASLHGSLGPRVVARSADGAPGSPRSCARWRASLLLALNATFTEGRNAASRWWRARCVNWRSSTGRPSARRHSYTTLAPFAP
jgi:hypothetical protein